jgi:hypothetical protein
LIGRINRKTRIYKYIACYGVVVAGRGEADAAIVVADIVACNCVVVAGIEEADAYAVVADIIACNCVVVAGIEEADAYPAVVADIVADIIACNDVVAGIVEVDTVLVELEFVALNPTSVIPSAVNVIALLLALASTTG